jgi:enoyl-CoA hydratase
MAQLAPLAVAMAKRALYEGFDTHLQAGLRIEDSAFLETMMSDDGLAALKAYLAQPYEQRRAWIERPVALEYKGR